jgi:hypothetical protein
MVSVHTLASVEGELSTICSRAIEVAQWGYCGLCGDPSFASISTIDNGPFLARCGFEFRSTEVAYPLDGQSRNPAPSRTAGHQIRLEGSPLGQRAHICAFFSNPDDEYRALLPFIKEGCAMSI